MIDANKLLTGSGEWFFDSQQTCHVLVMMQLSKSIHCGRTSRFDALPLVKLIFRRSL